MMSNKWTAGGLVFVLGASWCVAGDVDVRDTAGLRRALAEARAGDRIRLAPGTYAGGLVLAGKSGEAERPIIIESADLERPAEIEGGGTGLHLVGVSHVVVRGLVLSGATGNGLNIDDAGVRERPATDVTVEGVTVRNVGPRGNCDGIKMSGIDRFRVEDCLLERWGDGGSGIDMVGCHNGEIVRCQFRHFDGKGGNGVQAKGGSSGVVVENCRFEDAGERAVNLGGSTGEAFFRPPGAKYEAKDITVRGCTLIGSMAPVAFVGVEGSAVVGNVIYRPKRWGFRVLQENNGPGMVASRDGQFARNIVAFRRDEMTVGVNVGPGTAAETFKIAGNAWYCLDDPGMSRRELPIAETDAIYGENPQFEDEGRLDLRLKAGSPLSSLLSGDRR